MTWVLVFLALWISFRRILTPRSVDCADNPAPQIPELNANGNWKKP